MSFLPDNNERPGGGVSSSEEQPEMRSVALMSGPPKLTPLSATPQFGKAPPIGLTRPKGGLSRQSFTVTQEWTSTVCSSDVAAWNVKGEDLEMVPVDFPLERTHREICCDASEVAKRISESLQRMSIDAEYEKAKAKCKTMECVKFRIRLYAGGDSGQPVVVEVQRRSGSPSSFMRSCRAILDAAEGSLKVETAPAAPKLLSPPPLQNIGAMKCLQSVELSGPSPEEEVSMAFDSAANLCKSNKRDSVILGLQSLRNLTDPLKSSLRASSKVSHWIIMGHETHSTREDISSILQIRLDEEEEELGAIVEQQKHYALIALANALDMCAKDGSLAKAFEEHSSWFETMLIPSLLEAVKGASISASNAYTACRGICTLLLASDAALRVLYENGSMEDLKMAHNIGLQTHDLLASEAARCLQSFENKDL